MSLLDAAKTSLIVETLRTQPTSTLIRCLVIADRLAGAIIDPELRSLGLAALCHHARTQTAAKYGSQTPFGVPISLCVFGVLSLGFGFGFLLCLDDAVCVVGECAFSLWCGPDMTKLRKTGELSGLPLDGEGPKHPRIAASFWLPGYVSSG